MNKIINQNISEVISYININYINKPIIIVGMMGAGKSAIGRILARSLKRRFYDIDESIERLYHMKIYDIFEKYGEDKFRNLEHEEIKKIDINANNIIATGGGAFTFNRNYKILNKIGLTIWLNADQETIAQRLKKNINNRPLLKNVEIDKYVANLLLKRNPLYSRAHLSIMSKGYSKLQMRNKTLIEIKKYLVNKNNG